MICKVAILDSGINRYFEDKVTEVYSIYGSNHHDDNGHGTKCLSLIERLAPNTEFIIYKILDSNLQCSVKHLCTALTKLLDIDVDIINLSLTMCNKEKSYIVNEICQQLWSQGKIILSSKANRGNFSYPAESDFVIGVDGNQFRNDTDFWFKLNEPINCIASRTPSIVSLGNDKYSFFSGNSKATACMTGILSKNIDKLYGLDMERKKECIYHLANQNEWNKNEVSADIFKPEKDDFLIDYEVMRFVISLLRQYGYQGGEYLYECFDAKKIIEIVKKIVDEYKFGFYDYEFNLYDFFNEKSLCSKICNLIYCNKQRR